MTTNQERKEIIAVVTSVRPILDAFYRGDLSDEQIEFLREFVTAIFPTVQSVIAGVWDKLEPILIQVGQWPIGNDPSKVISVTEIEEMETGYIIEIGDIL